MRPGEIRASKAREAMDFRAGCRCDACRKWFARRAAAVARADRAMVYVAGRGWVTYEMPPAGGWEGEGDERD